MSSNNSRGFDAFDTFVLIVITLSTIATCNNSDRAADTLERIEERLEQAIPDKPLYDTMIIDTLRYDYMHGHTIKPKK